MISIHSSYGFLLAKAAHKFEEVAQPSFDKFGLTPKQFGTLLVISEYPKATQKKIGEIQKIDRTSIGHIIDQLQSKGYITKSQSSSDRKANIINLTEGGNNCIKLLWKEKEDWENRVLSCLSNLEKDELFYILKKVVGVVDNE